MNFIEYAISFLGLFLTAIGVYWNIKNRREDKRTFQISNNMAVSLAKKEKLLAHLSDYLIYSRCILSKYTGGSIHKDFKGEQYPLHWISLKTLTSSVRSSLGDGCKYKTELINALNIINGYSEFVWQHCYHKKNWPDVKEEMTDLEYRRLMSNEGRPDLRGFNAQTFNDCYSRYIQGMSLAIDCQEKIEEIIVKIGVEDK